MVIIKQKYLSFLTITSGGESWYNLEDMNSGPKSKEVGGLLGPLSNVYTESTNEPML